MDKYYTVGENITMGSYVSEGRDGKLYRSLPNQIVAFQTPQALKEGDMIRINEHGAIDVGMAHIGIDPAHPEGDRTVHVEYNPSKDKRIAEMGLAMSNEKIYALAKWLYEMYQSKARIFGLIGALDNEPFAEAKAEEVKTFLAMAMEVKTIFDQVASTGTPLSTLDFTKHCPYYNPDCPICPKVG